MIYSNRRNMYPMKRVDFDPNGERNEEKRGESGYVRISWDEALDIVANEIRRDKREFGPGAIADGTQFPPLVGFCRLSPQRPASFYEHGRRDLGRPQPR